MDDGDAVRAGVSVRLVTHPHSVRTARQLPADALRDWGLPLPVDDAGLVVTELRIAVRDDGDVPAAAVAIRQGGPASAALSWETTTGRGLAIVQELAVDWGVTVEDDRKWVWALLAPPGPDACTGRAPPPLAAPPPPVLGRRGRP